MAAATRRFPGGVRLWARGHSATAMAQNLGARNISRRGRQHPSARCLAFLSHQVVSVGIIGLSFVGAKLRPLIRKRKVVVELVVLFGNSVSQSVKTSVSRARRVSRRARRAPFYPIPPTRSVLELLDHRRDVGRLFFNFLLSGSRCCCVFQGAFASARSWRAPTTTQKDEEREPLAGRVEVGAGRVANDHYGELRGVLDHDAAAAPRPHALVFDCSYSAQVGLHRSLDRAPAASWCRERLALSGAINPVGNDLTMAASANHACSLSAVTVESARHRPAASRSTRTTR